MDSEIFNLLEGLSWVTLGVVGLIIRRLVKSEFKKLAYFSTVILIAFGLSDFAQVIHGTFLVPGMEWLLIWKFINLIGLLACFVWYFRLRLRRT